jgi:hypothetical protein
MKSTAIIFTALLVCGFTVVGWRSLAQQRARYATQQSGTHRLAGSMQAKLDHIERNGERAHPDQAPTVMSEEEINDYFASGRVKMPQGVKKVRLRGRSGVVDAFLTVDFDEIRQQQRSMNPLLGVFSGTHEVAVEADAVGAAGQGKVHVRTVSMDDVQVPRVALEFFVEKYITSKYPNIGMDSHFPLPDKIDSARVGYHKLTVVQK